MQEYEIAIVDDDLQDAIQLREYFSSYGEFHCSCYDCVEKFLTSKRTYDVLVLDIEMKKYNGIALAEYMKQHQDLPIVFASWHEHYVFDTFAVRPLFFIRKKYEKEDVAKCVGLIKDYFKKDQILEIVDQYQKYFVHINDIVYCQVEHRKTKIYRKQGEVLCCGLSLKQLEEQLPKTFVRINHCTLVELSQIREIHEFNCILKQGIVLDISYRKKKELYKCWKQFLEGKV